MRSRSRTSYVPRCKSREDRTVQINTMKTVPGVVMFEGMPGSGKSTDSRTLADRLTKAGIATAQWPEGPHRPSCRLRTGRTSRRPRTRPTSRRSSDRGAGAGRRPLPRCSRELRGPLRLERGVFGCPQAVSRRLRQLRRAGDAGAALPRADCKLGTVWTAPPWGSHANLGMRTRAEPRLHLPCAFRPPTGRVSAPRVGLGISHRSDESDVGVSGPGDPEDVLRRAAAERPAEWLNAVIEYHTGQGYGQRSGLSGFEGYVEFMRYRRSVELALLPHLQIPTLHVRTSEVIGGDRADMIHSFATSSRKSTL